MLSEVPKLRPILLATILTRPPPVLVVATSNVSTQLIGSIDNTKTLGVNPIQIESVEYLGFQIATNSCSHRDLGFTGKIAGKWYAIFGDTLYCASGITDVANDPPGFHGMARNSISLLTNNPLRVIDLNLNNDWPVPHQLQFVPFNPAWGEVNTTVFGGTSLCETDAETATAAIYYMVNAYEPLVGAGVGEVEVINGIPTVTYCCGPKGYWWDAKFYAHYGDKIAYRDERSDYIYIWGGPPNRYTGWLEGSYIYLARVKTVHAFDLDRYEYFWGGNRDGSPKYCQTSQQRQPRCGAQDKVKSHGTNTTNAMCWFIWESRVPPSSSGLPLA